MDNLKDIIKETVEEVMAQLTKEEIPQGDDMEVMSAVNIAEEGSEKVEVKLLAPQGTAYFHNHGCIVANHSGTPIKAVCTEIELKGQRAYYVRLDEA